jgi:uncharacterized protein YutE (UPF0331/DUF86 family)
MISKNKVIHKIQFIKKQLEMLREIADKPKSEFIGDSILPVAATRLLQISIEAMIDLANHIVSRNHWGIPKTYGEAFLIMQKKDLITEGEYQTYLKMVRFRNRAVHLYDEIDDEEIYKILKNNLADFENYIKNVGKLLREEF